MLVSHWVRGILLLGCLGTSAQDEDLGSRSPEELTELCSRAEDAVAAQPKDLAALARLDRLYALAGVKPLLSTPSPYRRLDDPTFDGSPARGYRDGENGDFYLVRLDGVRYRSYFRADGKILSAKVGGFGPLRSLARLATSDPKDVLPAAEKALPDLRVLEETGAAIRKAAGTDAEPEALTRAAERLSAALQADGGRVGLLEELVHIYDRLGEVTLGSAREPEYRRLQVAAAAKLGEALPDAPTTHRSLALVYFRLGAYPLAVQEAVLAKDDPLAGDLTLVLRSWSQEEHEKVDSFDVDGVYRVEAYRTKAAPPESGELFAELTYVVRRPNRAEFAVYTLSSQKLKSRRHYYVYFSYLGQRTLLTTYADQRPQDGAVREKVATLIRRLSDGAKKDK